jgi:hypothetical protein
MLERRRDLGHLIAPPSAWRHSFDDIPLVIVTTTCYKDGIAH